MGTRYADPSDITALALPAQALSGVSLQTQEMALDSASATIDSYIGARLDLPLTAWGLDLRKAAADIAGYLLLKGRGWNPTAGDSEQVRLAYQDAVSWLKDVSAGRATPQEINTVDSAPESAPSEPSFAVSPASGSLGTRAGSFFSRDSDQAVAVGIVGPPRQRGW